MKSRPFFLLQCSAASVLLAASFVHAADVTINSSTSTGGTITVNTPDTLTIAVGSTATRTLSNAITLDGGTLKGGVMDNVATVSVLSGTGTSSTSVDVNGVTIILKGSGTANTTANLTLASGVTVTGANQLLVGGGAGGGGAQAGKLSPDGGGGGGGYVVLTTGNLSGTLALTAGSGGSSGAGLGGAGGAGGTTSIGATQALGGGATGLQTGTGGNSSKTINGVTSNFTGGAGSGTGGGGGAGSSSNGSNGSGTTGGAGGNGTQITTGVVGLSTYLGSDTFGGGGGAGAGTSTPGTGGAAGTGGGGAGSGSSNGGAGTHGLGGGGGGGGGTQTRTGGAGGAGSVAIQYAYNSNVAAGTLTLSGGITLNSTSTLDAVRSGGLIDVTTNAITGTGGINIASSASPGGVVQLSVANTYVGNTTVNAAAILRMNATNALPNGSGTGNLSLSGTLDLNGQTTTSLNGLSGAGTIDNNSGVGTYALSVGNNNQTSTFSGVIQNTTGTLGLTKAGTGTLTLSGTNTYSGGTVVSAGILEVNNTSGSGTGGGTVTVNGTLAGEGSITTDPGKSVFLNGTLQVGSIGATAGTDFSINSSTILGGASSTVFELFSGNHHTVDTASADMLRLSGSLDIQSGATLKLAKSSNFMTAFTDGDVFQLFDWNSVTPTGTYTTYDVSDLALGPGLYADYSKLYTAGTVSLLSIPEPSRALLLMAGAFGLMMRRRRVA